MPKEKYIFPESGVIISIHDRECSECQKIKQTTYSLQRYINGRTIIFNAYEDIILLLAGRIRYGTFDKGNKAV